MKFKYDKQSDVLALEFSNAPIDYAKEVGNFIVHFSPDDRPVYIEILNARNFAKDVQKEVVLEKV